MRRHAWPISKELRSAIKIHNEANRAAKVESHKPTWRIRAEANAVRRELKRDATMTKAQRSRAEHVRQRTLTIKRALLAQRERVGKLLQGMPSQERKTETGIVLPSGPQIGEVLGRVSESKGR